MMMEINLEEVPEFALAYLEDLQSEGKMESTITRYYRDLRFFFKWLKEKEMETDLDTFEKLDLSVYKRFYDECKEKYSNSTIKRIRTVISSLQRYYELEVADYEGLADSLIARPLIKQDFTTETEFNKLIHTMKSERGLTDNQLKAFPFLSRRNQSIAVLFYHYGLRMSEIPRINMEDMNFGQNELVIKDGNEGKRKIQLEQEHKRIIYAYFKEDIPSPVRPYDHSPHPLFVSFDFERETFRWNYDKAAPQRLSVKAIQKMMKQEVARAGLPKGVSAQSMRNRCIIRKMKEGLTTEELQAFFGLKNPLSLWRYEKYIEENKKA